MTANERGAKGGLQGKARYGLTLVLGMLVLFWRIVIPTQVDITAGIVILCVALDLILTASVVFLNRKELKEAFSKRFTGKVFLKIILAFVILYVASIIVVVILITLGIEPADPARLVGSEFRRVFPLGAVISMVIVAPLLEETVFRMAGKNLIKNGVLYVLITSLLFAFIHTVNFSIVDNIDYFISGVVFSAVYLKTKDIRITMGAHFLFNVIGVLMGLLQG